MLCDEYAFVLSAFVCDLSLLLVLNSVGEMGPISPISWGVTLLFDSLIFFFFWEGLAGVELSWFEVWVVLLFSAGVEL